MREIRTSGSMSGEGNGVMPDGPSHRAPPRLYFSTRWRHHVNKEVPCFLGPSVRMPQAGKAGRWCRTASHTSVRGASPIPTANYRSERKSFPLPHGRDNICFK